MHFLVLFYGTDHISSCLGEVRRCFGRHIEAQGSNLILIQNQDTDSAGFVPGNNRDHEFSGWQVGWERLQSRGVDDGDALVVVNDSFHRNYDASIWRDHYERLFGVGVVGWRGQLPEGVVFEDVPNLSYFRTNCFVVSAGALRRAGGFLPPERVDRPLTDPHLSPSYRDFLVSWLTGTNHGSVNLKHFWYRAEPLTPQSEDRLQAKARAIYHEHHLAHRLWSAGVAPAWIQDQPEFRHRWSRYQFWKRVLPLKKPGGARWQG